MLLVTVGYLAIRRLLERPSLGRQAVVALITGLLLYTHYWSFYLIAVVAALLVWQAWRGADAAPRHRPPPRASPASRSPPRLRVWEASRGRDAAPPPAARSGLVALVAGAITFLPW